MALMLPKLTSAVVNAFTKGIKTNPIGAEGKFEVTCESTRDDVADMLASAIVDYASDAQIKFQPGPFLFPNPVPPHVPPTLPDLVSPFVPCFISTAAAGEGALKTSIKACFASEDPSWSALSAGLFAYAATLTLFRGSLNVPIATGATVMVVPPVFLPVTTAGLAGAGLEAQAVQLATLIDAAFKTCIFNGTGFTPLLGVGPVLAQPLF